MFINNLSNKHWFDLSHIVDKHQMLYELCTSPIYLVDVTGISVWWLFYIDIPTFTYNYTVILQRNMSFYLILEDKHLVLVKFLNYHYLINSSLSCFTWKTTEGVVGVAPTRCLKSPGRIQRWAVRSLMDAPGRNWPAHIYRFTVFMTRGPNVYYFFVFLFATGEEKTPKFHWRTRRRRWFSPVSIK